MTAPLLQQPRWYDKRYHSLDFFLKETYHEKLYRLALNGGMTCPNRDGTLGTGGCIFCSRGGSGDFASCSTLSINQQIEDAKLRLSGKVQCSHYIAYFQAYTNTYAPVSYLRRIFMEAVNNPDIAILSIATRPDCLGSDVLALLDEINQIKPVWVELGLQSMHEDTARLIRRGFPLSIFESAVQNLHSLGISVITHLILSLPGEDCNRILESVDYLGTLPIQGVKLQLLHVLKDTDLADYYDTNPFPIFSMEEYCNLIADCIEHLPPQIVIHRLTGDGPRNLLLAPMWSTNKKAVLNQIQKTLKNRNTYQGYFLDKKE